MPAIDEKRLSDFENEFDRYGKQKRRTVGGTEPRVLQNLAMYVGEQWVWFERGTLKNRNPRRDEQGRISEVNLVLNMIAPRQQKIVGRLTTSEPDFRAFPDQMDPSKMAMADIVSKVIRALNYKLDEDYLRWQRWFWMMIGGLAIEHLPWRPNSRVDVVERLDEMGNPVWEHLASGEEVEHFQFQVLTGQLMPDGSEPIPGQQNPAQTLPEHFKRVTEVKQIGDVGDEIRGPLNIFCPNSIRSLDELAPGQSLMFGDVRLVSWAKQTWPDADFSDVHGEKDFKIISTRVSEKVSFVNTSLRDLIPVIQGAVGEDDPDMVPVIERYEPVGPDFPPGWSLERDAATGPGFVPAPSDDFANGGRYSVFIPGQTVLRDGEIPYQDGIPARDFHWDVAVANFFSPDWQSAVNGVQKSINVLASQMRQLTNARIFDPILMEDDLEPIKTDSPRYWPGALEDGVPKAARLGGQDVSSSHLRQFESLVQMFNELAGGDDLFSEDKFPGQIRGTGAVSILQDVMDTQWGPKLIHYYKRLGEVHHKRVNRLKQFYPESRTLRLVDSSGKVEVFKFHASKVLRAGVDFTITVAPSSILPETRRERFSRLNEMLSGPLAGLYMNTRTGQPDWNAIASELQFGDFEGREAKVAKDERFAKSVIAAIKEGREVAPVLPFQNHVVFIDELEDEMNDDDFFETLQPETQQALIQRYLEHNEMLSQLQQQAQEAQFSEETAGIVRQAVQQSLAQYQSVATEALIKQMRGLAQSDPASFQAVMFGQGGEEGVQ